METPAFFALLHVSATELVPQALRSGGAKRTAIGYTAGAAVVVVRQMECVGGRESGAGAGAKGRRRDSR